MADRDLSDSCIEIFRDLRARSALVLIFNQDARILLHFTGRPNAECVMTLSRKSCFRGSREPAKMAAKVGCRLSAADLSRKFAAHGSRHCFPSWEFNSAECIGGASVHKEREGTGRALALHPRALIRLLSPGLRWRSDPRTSVAFPNTFAFSCRFLQLGY